MSPDNRPNFVVLFADDHRYASVGINGNTQVRTPNLDAIGKRGTIFDGAHCQGGMHGAVCVPSRASLMTGRNIFASSNDPSGRDWLATNTIPYDMPTFPELLRAAGYRTYAVGKWHNDASSFARSFDDGDCLMFGGMSDHDCVPIRPFDPTGMYSEETAVFADGFSTDLFADAAIRYIRQQAGFNPFCLYVAFTSPHDPRTPPEKWQYDPSDIDMPANAMPVHPFDNGEMLVRDEQLETWPRQPESIRQHIADYCGMISHMDDRIGQIIVALETEGLAENTIVIYTADHGVALGQHGLMGKQNLYEHSTHVPLLMAGPGINAGQRVAELVWHGDTTATLLELAGEDSSIASDGRSLKLFLGGEPLSDWREYAGAAYRFTQRSIRDSRWKLISYSTNPDWRKNSEQTEGSNVTQMFDLELDPWERINLAWVPEFAHIRARLESALSLWQQENGDPALGS